MNGVNNTVSVIREMVGKEGHRVLNKQEFLEAAERIDKGVAERIAKAVEGITEPTFEVSGKTTANYNIAGIKIKDGEKVVGKGACSASIKDYTSAPELKSRLDLPDGTMQRGKSVENNEFLSEETNKLGESVKKKIDIESGKITTINKFDTNVVDEQISPNHYNVRKKFLNKDGEIVKKIEVDSSDIEHSIKEILSDGSVVETDILKCDNTNKPIINISCTNEISDIGKKCSYNSKEQKYQIKLFQNNYSNRDDFCDFDIGIILDKDLNIEQFIDYTKDVGITPHKVFGVREEFVDKKYIGKRMNEELAEKIGIKELYKKIKELPEDIAEIQRLKSQYFKKEMPVQEEIIAQPVKKSIWSRLFGKN